VPIELRPRAAELEMLLSARFPAPLPRAVVVHGDYRLGNMLSVGPDPQAIIDWEIWSIGDPRVDLGWFLLFADHENFPGAGAAVAGMPEPRELLMTYEEASGAPVSDAGWFECFARYKTAAIMGHNLRRHREGRHHDPYQETLQPTILELVERSIRVLR
jgi:aminoglycoside phosphotransferase (APT) family kinase protein